MGGVEGWGRGRCWRGKGGVGFENGEVWGMGFRCCFAGWEGRGERVSCRSVGRFCCY